jgi:hypothetical protein
MKALKILLLVLAAGFVIIQFLPSGMPENKPDDANSIASGSVITEPVMSRLRTACFDCHSNQTNFPWYSKIAPTSWFLADHIKEGRSHLNFSEWETYNNRKKIKKLEDIVDEVKSGGMPLKSYLIIHKDARLSNEDISSITAWADTTASNILKR